MTNLDTSKLVPPKSLQPALTLTGAQVFRLADIIGNDPGSEDDQISIQFLAAGLDGPGLYAWMTEYPDEGACPLFDTSVGAQAKQAA
jgi:hypothetical protein